MILHNKIATMPRNQFDEKLLLFMEDFTASALQVLYMQESAKFQEETNNNFFEDHLQKNQMQFALQIGTHKEDPNFGL